MVLTEKNIPHSPNWFLSGASDANEAGIYVYASRMNVCVFDVSDPSLGLRLLGRYLGHAERVSSVVLSPYKAGTTQRLSVKKDEEAGAYEEEREKQEMLCCSSGDDMTVKIWMVDSLTDVQSHSEHKEKVSSVSWSAVNPNLIASGDVKGEVILWNRKSNIVSKWRQEKDHIFCTGFCPHQPALLAVGMRQGTVFLVEFSSGVGQVVHRLRGHEEEVLSLSWCPVPGETFLKETEDGGSILEDPDRDLSGCLIATGSKDRTIRVWSCTQGRQLFMKRLPNMRRESADQGVRLKAWLAVHWLKSNPELLASSSSTGELLLWTLKYVKGQSYEIFNPNEFRCHTRPVFNICASGPEGKILCTFAQDRQVVLWNADTVEAVASVTTLGGHVYCIRNSPIDPGRVAIGTGDTMIRVWNTSNKNNPYDINIIWQGMKSKVTAVAWHPTKEAILGFGTEDGRVGTVDAFSNRMPKMSGTFHRRTVYVVCWGPPSANPADERNYSLYSVGDCKVLEHTSNVLSKGDMDAEAVDITQKIMTVNSEHLSNLKATEMSWNMNIKVAAVGADDGSVYIFSSHGWKLLASIKTQKKLMNCARWHPFATDESPHGSPGKNWLAIGGNDQILHVLDLSTVFEKGSEADNMLILNSLREFTGHCQRITDICWSPHHNGRLVSVGYEAEIFVWDVQKGMALAQFKGHGGRVLTCQFSGLDPDLVMTGGADSIVLVWRVSQQSAPEFSERKKRKRRRAHAAVDNGDSPPQTVSVAGEDEDAGDKSASDQTSMSPSSDVQHLQELLDSKRQALSCPDQAALTRDGRAVISYGDAAVANNAGAHSVADSSRDSKDHDNLQAQTPRSFPSVSYSTSSPPLSAQSRDKDAGQEAGGCLSSAAASSDSEEAEVERAAGARVDTVRGGRVSTGGTRSLTGVRTVTKGVRAGETDAGRARKRKVKSYFPETAQAENKGRGATHEDILLLTRLQYGGETDGEAAREEDERKCADSSGQPQASGGAGGSGGHAVPADKHHLSLFTADRKAVYTSLHTEVSHHISHDNMEYALQMELWKGNISGVIQLARDRAQLSDWIVSLAPLASYDTWLTLCEEYAEQLEEEGQYHKAVSYLLVCHKLYPAIDLFRRHKLFREAVALARVRLSPLDPVLEDLYTDWSEQLMRDGAYEQAAKCYLAMKHIQDAAQVIARRSDQASLKTACHMTLVANEKQQGQLYAQQVVTRFLLNRQWMQCLTFLREHQPLKVFIPYVSVHEMMMKELATLLPDMVAAAASTDCQTASTWDTTPADKLGLPEFILDPKESDPVLPWEPYLVTGHTFPHHVLRVWHLHLGVTMETEQLHLVYHALQQLQSGRQVHLDTQQVLLQVCADITLWLLALLTNQTSLAISHLLGALSALHDGGHHRLLTALCRLILPQGPKYTLKLQQEATALRVLINMESQVDVEGGGKHLSLRRYLSELKDEPSVSTGALRCKQLDCVRAFYYLSVLHYLQRAHSHSAQDAHRPESSPTTQPAVSGDSQSEGQGTAVSASGLSNVSASADKDGEAGKGEMLSETVPGASDGDRGAAGGMKDRDGGSSVDLPELGRQTGDNGDGDQTFSKAGSWKGKAEEGSNGVKAQPSDVGEAGDSKSREEQREAVSGSGSRKDGSEGCGASLLHLSLSQLLQLSKGLLWDVQAKRLALTDTLGYIHHAISQHLLTDHSREVAKTLSRHPHAGSNHGHLHHHHHHHHPEMDNAPSFAPVLADTVAAHLPADPLLNIDDVGVVSLPQPEGGGGGAEGGASPGAPSTNSSTVLSSSSPSLSSPPSSLPPSTPTSSTQDADRDSTRRDMNSQPGPNLDSLPESNFDLDLVTMGQQWDGSRRVLWQDDPVSGSSRGGEGRRSVVDSSVHKPTSLLSPAKYINVPDEWYSLPVDEKYARSYVTLAILKDEQEFVMGELKRISDSSQVPFPNPFHSVQTLLSVCLTSESQLLSAVDKHNYVKGLQSWAMHFAVTAQQRSNADVLFASAEKDIGL